MVKAEAVCFGWTAGENFAFTITETLQMALS